MRITGNATLTVGAEVILPHNHLSKLLIRPQKELYQLGTKGCFVWLSPLCNEEQEILLATSAAQDLSYMAVM